jgi:hypothetical protein
LPISSSPPKRSELSAFAVDLGLNAHHIQRAHRAFLDRVVETALFDGLVADTEIDELFRTAALLDLDVDFVTNHTDAYRMVRDTIALNPGLSVCFTGSATDHFGNEIDRGEVEAFALRSGLVAKDSVTAHGCELLVAADTATKSGKADQARRFGIPLHQ